MPFAQHSESDDNNKVQADDNDSSFDDDKKLGTAEQLRGFISFLDGS